MMVKDLIKKLQRMPQEAFVRRPFYGFYYKCTLPVQEVYKEWEPVNFLEEEIVVVID
jgi:hypothetical protein